MARAILFVVCFLGPSVGFAAASPRSICFERGQDIWMANLDGTAPRRIARGDNPYLSPDGTRIAFTTNLSTAKSLERHVAVIDVATKKVTIFKDEIPSDNSQKPTWSPDGAYLLFNVWTEDAWHLALMNANGSAFRYVQESTPENRSLWSPGWAPDSHAIFAQDLDKLYRFTLDGTELQHWSLRGLFPKGSLSSGSTISVSPDGKTLLMDVDMDEEHVATGDWQGPPPAVWTLDTASRKAERLTPPGVLAWAGCWLDERQILFSGLSAGQKETSIFQMTLKGRDKRSLLRRGNTPTVSRASSD